MNNTNGFRKNDLIAALIIGEISAWLIFILAQEILPENIYGKVSLVLKTLPLVFPILCAIFLYIVFLFGKKITVANQIGKFVLVGGFNTLVDWGILSLLIYVFHSSLGIDSEDILLDIFYWTIIYYSLFKGISFILAATNSYLWNKFWTFQRETTEKVGKEFVQFFTITFIGFLINVGIASCVFKYIQPFGGLNSAQWAIFSAVIATAVSMIWNFLGYKFIVFDRKQPVEISSAI